MAHFSNQDRRNLDNLVTLSPIVGEGSPEGKVSAVPGRMYVDITTDNLYLKGGGSGSGPEGWILK